MDKGLPGQIVPTIIISRNELNFKYLSQFQTILHQDYPGEILMRY